MSDFTDDAEREWGDAMAEGKFDTPSVTSHDTVSPSLSPTDDTDTNVAMTSPTIDTELDDIFTNYGIPEDGKNHTDCLLGEIMYCEHTDPLAKQQIKALIERENLRVTLELMEKHHIPLQTHTLDATHIEQDLNTLTNELPKFGYIHDNGIRTDYVSLAELRTAITAYCKGETK